MPSRLDRGPGLYNFRLLHFVEVASDLLRIEGLHIAVLAQGTPRGVQESCEVSRLVLTAAPPLVGVMEVRVPRVMTTSLVTKAFLCFPFV